jgi:hypothetical protein
MRDAERLLAEDFEPFVDRGTLRFSPGRASWEQDEIPREVQLTAGPDDLPSVTLEGKTYRYKNFLASPTMARLDRLADKIRKRIDLAHAYVPTQGRLIPDAAIDGRGESVTFEDSGEVIRDRSTKGLPWGATRLIFVSGEAGSGKTMALRRLARTQAELFASRKADFLYLYVNAQGRALATLDAVIAQELDDLQANWLVYGAVTTLVRRGLLVPIIDGFDELLGSGGYDDAFASLAALLSSLDRQGVVIGSARSTFFDYRSFREQAERYRSDESAGGLQYELDTVEILPWAEDRTLSFFFSRGEARNGRGVQMQHVAEKLLKGNNVENAALLGKPFYAETVARLYLDEGSEITGEEALLDELVLAFLRREVVKYKEKELVILDVQGHRKFLQMLAEEMWTQECRDLDVGTIQIVAQLLAEHLKLPAANANALVQRVSSYPFFEKSRTSRKRHAFQHEVFYGYFLAEHLGGLLAEGGFGLRSFLGRSVVEGTLAAEVARRAPAKEEERRRLIETLGRAVGKSLSDQQARENAAELTVSLVRNAMAQTEGLQLENLVFRGSDFRDVSLQAPVFRDCELDGVALAGAKLRRPVFERTVLREVKVDKASTRLDAAVIVVGETLLSGLWTWTTNGDKRRLERIDSPREVARLLRRLGAVTPGLDEEGAPKYEGRVKARVDLLLLLVRVLERLYHITEEDLRRRTAFEGREWPGLKKLLMSTGVLEEYFIQKSGRPEPLMRLTVPPEFVRKGEVSRGDEIPAGVRELWDRLRAER